ncbi:cytosolic 5'-nucleotidase 1A-like protein [Lates japonicus]|uniref:Cytosolic 5'-nucleotidase 1A-like protein n=1 Tax=Lates japonicus TaxID=270547 RepID=A0AAD3MDL1_LATJO|nr:cytosolic 5'-nucleotidase 1A-like protein [Lates japonicus]
MSHRLAMMSHCCSDVTTHAVLMLPITDQYKSILSWAVSGFSSVENQTSQKRTQRLSSRETESHCSNRGHDEEVQFAERPQDGAAGSVTLNSYILTSWESRGSWEEKEEFDQDHLGLSTKPKPVTGGKTGRWRRVLRNQSAVTIAVPLASCFGLAWQKVFEQKGVEVSEDTGDCSEAIVHAGEADLRIKESQLRVALTVMPHSLMSQSASLRPMADKFFEHEGK